VSALFCQVFAAVIDLAHTFLTIAAEKDLTLMLAHMDAPVEISKQGYRRERIQRGRLALLISLLSLVFAAWSLFETALRQPIFNVYTGPFWQYGRGADTDDEFLIVPMTFANNGARPGAVLSLELTVEKSGSGRREFLASAVVPGERDRALFAPVSVPGRTAYTASIIFTPRDGAKPIKSVIDAPGNYTAHLTVCTTYNKSFGLFDTLLTIPAPDIMASLALQHFEIGQLLDKRTETVTAKTSSDSRSSSSSSSSGGVCVGS
jgi:hypothetical protein